MAPQTQMTMQDKLIQVDSVITALETLKAEILQRRDTLLSEEHLRTMIGEIVSRDEFTKSLASSIVTQIGSTSIIRGVRQTVSAEIEQHIDSYLTQQLSQSYLESRMANLIERISGNGGSLDSVKIAPPQPRLEDLTFDTSDEISQMMRLLAGDDAVV
jgi:hypothetical protein